MRKKIKKPKVFVFKNAPYFNSRKGEVMYQNVEHEFMSMNLKTFIEAISINERLMDLRKGYEQFIHSS